MSLVEGMKSIYPVELGVTMLPEYVQSEGVERILELVADVAGARSVTTSPYVVGEATPETGEREPPGDAGAGNARLLDRELFGKREIWMTAAPSFAPCQDLYQGLAYAPPEANALTDEAGPIVGRFLEGAKKRGLDTWMQIMAAIPPSHRVQFGGPNIEDQPLLPDGTRFQSRVDNNGSLASEDLRNYLRAITTDLCRAYPQVDGFKFDWPEYPVYHFESLFFDFNPQTSRFAAKIGVDFEVMRKGALRLLSDISDGAIRRGDLDVGSLDAFRESLKAAYPVVEELIAFRGAIVEDFAIFLRNTVDDVGKGKKSIFLQAFPPPLNVATGFDYGRVAPHCDLIGVKFYTMHWPLIERNYLRYLQDKADIHPRDVAKVLSTLLQLSGPAERDPTNIRYPEPGDWHPAPSDSITAKMRAAREQIEPDAKSVGITHAYGPVADVMRRLDAVCEGAEGAVHINRCAYLSNEKIEAIGSYVRERAGPKNMAHEYN